MGGLLRMATGTAQQAAILRDARQTALLQDEGVGFLHTFFANVGAHDLTANRDPH